MTQALWPADYGVSPDHCGDVLRGSYDIPLEFKTPPVILDLGANVGAFAVWASKRWQGAEIHCYEPHPGTFKLLWKTIEREKLENCIPYDQGVHEVAKRCKIFSGPNNIGEASVLQKWDTDSFEIDLIAAKDLPDADILKMDTEGCEALILKGLIDSNRLKKLSAVMMETHGPADQEWIMGKLAENGFTLTNRNQWHANRAELCYVRTDLLPKDFKRKGPKRVLIATPLAGGTSAHYLGGLVTLLKADWQERYDFGFKIKTGGSVATARNMAADDAIKGGYDKILWWDKDLAPESMDTFLSMANHLLGHDADLVGATYVAHTKHTHFHGKMKEDAVPDSRGLLLMEQIPLGFCVMDVKALLKIKAKFPLRTYTSCEGGGNVVKDLYEFFHEGIIGPNTPEGKLERIETAISNGFGEEIIVSILADNDTSANQRYGEDYFFCNLCAKAGVEMFRDTAFIMPHEQTIRMPIPTEDLNRMLAEEWRKPPKK